MIEFLYQQKISPADTAVPNIVNILTNIANIFHHRSHSIRSLSTLGVPLVIRAGPPLSEALLPVTQRISLSISYTIFYFLSISIGVN